jgi:hypothetical protein
MTTFVTSFINLDNDDTKSVSWRFERFLDVVKTGIKLCVYVDSCAEEMMLDVVKEYSNVMLMETFCIEELFSYKVCSSIEHLQLPHTNNAKKDKKEYMMIMNSKIEFLKRTMEKDLTQLYDLYQKSIGRTKN